MQSKEQETIVLVHGIWMHGLQLQWLGWQLKRRGFQVRHYSYRSVLRTPEENARWLLAYLKTLKGKVHLVGHSLGGIVILHLLNQYPNVLSGRVVLVGSPVKGSQTAKSLMRIPLLGTLILGKSTERGLLGDVPYYRAPTTAGNELGTIVGSHSFGIGHLFSRLSECNDGTVLCKETRLAQGKDTIELKLTHTALVFSKRVATQIICFINHAHFCKSQD